MLKKLLLIWVLLIATMGLALADVEVNSADQAALDGVKGVGPAMSKKILEERKAHGEFKDWADFQKRVKGIGDKSSVNFSNAGLRVNGQAKPGASAASAPAAAPAAKPATASVPVPAVTPTAASTAAASKGK
jgi:competence protein ComEA